MSILALIGIAVQLPLQTVHAANNLYLDPASVSVVKDGQITITARASGTGFNAAQLDVAYDSAKLQYISYSVAGSVLPSVAAFTQSSGTINLTPYSTSPATGDNLLLASFTFKALADNGTGSISLLNSSAIVANGSALFTFTGSQCTVSFTSSSTSTPPSPTPTPTPTPAPVPAATTPSSQQPTIKSPTTQTAPSQQTPVVTAPSTDSVPPSIVSTTPAGFVGQPISIKVVTNEPTRSIIKFGSSKEDLLQTVTSDSLAESYFVSLGTMSEAFEKDTTYYYVVEAIDAAGNKTISEINQINTATVSILLTVKDGSDNELPNTLIVVNGKEYTTDEKGATKITDVLRGVVAVSVTYDGTLRYIGDITTVKGSTTQAYDVSPDGIKQINALLLGLPALQTGIYAALALASLLAGALAIRGFKKINSERREVRLHSANPWGNAVHTTQPTHQHYTASHPDTKPAQPNTDPHNGVQISTSTPYAPETVFSPQTPKPTETPISEPQDTPKNQQ